MITVGYGALLANAALAWATPDMTLVMLSQHFGCVIAMHMAQATRQSRTWSQMGIHLAVPNKVALLQAVAALGCHTLHEERRRTTIYSTILVYPGLRHQCIVHAAIPSAH
jgi:hypothetical protein